MRRHCTVRVIWLAHSLAATLAIASNVWAGVTEGEPEVLEDDSGAVAGTAGAVSLSPPRVDVSGKLEGQPVDLGRVEITGTLWPSSGTLPAGTVRGSRPSPSAGGRGGRAPTPGDKAKQPPDSEQNTKPVNCSPNPVVLATGEKLKTEPDFSANSLYGISLTRTYRSQHATGTVFGAHWTSSLDSSKVSYNLTNCIRLEESVCMPRNATVVNADGSTYIWS